MTEIVRVNSSKHKLDSCHTVYIDISHNFIERMYLALYRQEIL